MKSFKLKNGKLIFPEDFVLIESTITKDANYAGVVQEKNGTVPTFLFLSEKKVSDYTEKEKEKTIEECCKICKKLDEIRKNEIKDMWDGPHLINHTQWKDTPRVGFFEVMEIKDRKNLYARCGILREGEKYEY